VSYVPTQGNEILVPSEKDEANKLEYTPGHALMSWLNSRAEKWRNHRNTGYNRLWAEYWRMWRGKWGPEDRNRSSERSRLIAPALANAIEMTVAEIEEGLLGKETWFDVVDDDRENLDALTARDQLRYDFDKVNAKDSISEGVLNSAIFGTGIIKLNVEVLPVAEPVRDPKTMRLVQSSEERVYVTPEAIRPDEFIPDPAGRNINEMLGCFHEVKKPTHAVLEKIASGLYREDALPFLDGSPTPKTNEVDQYDPSVRNTIEYSTDTCEILEYHGKVPAELLAAIDVDTPLDAVMAQSGGNPRDDGPKVEAIVTIANNGALLRATPNPFVMQDRCVVAWQFEKVPGRFWGRGVCEKGYNPQKALDAEIRARIDALGYVSSPMLGVDYGRVPRGFKMEVKPGKVFLTQGNPDEILRPVRIGEINANTFNQAGDMERMVQMGTGAFDTAQALTSQGANSNGPSATNMSSAMGAFVKRSKRAIRNVNDNCVAPIIKKTMWRMMQFDPRRYPADFDFIVKPTMGIVAREVEAMQMTQLMAMLPEDFPQIRVAVAKGIVELSSLHNKAEIVQAFQEAMQPPSPEEQQKQKELADIQFEAAKAEATQSLLENQHLIAQIRKTLAEAAAMANKGQLDKIKTIQEQDRINIQAEEIDQFENQNEIAQKRLQLQEKQLNWKMRQGPSKNG
jgi:hypothetical protein